MSLVLYYSPKACSLACHIALKKSGLQFEARRVRLRASEHLTDAYKAVNAWGKIPALQIGDEVLTEAHAILTYVAGAAPDAQLLPRDGTLARAHEWMNFLSSTVHIAYRPLFKPNTLLDDPDMAPKLREFGTRKLGDALVEVDRRLKGRYWALGDSYSVCDPYLLVFYIWSQREDVVRHMPDLPNYRAVAERVLARVAARRALAREELSAAALKAP